MVSLKILSLLLFVGLWSLQVASSPLALLSKPASIAGQLLNHGLGAGTNSAPFNAAATTNKVLHGRGNDSKSQPVKLASRQGAIDQAMAKAMTLAPVLEDDLLPPHLAKRADDFSRLDLQQEVTMMYGGHAIEEQMYVANMTLQAPDSKNPLIMMEKFTTLTTSSECSLPEKKLTIKFKSKEAMEQVSKSWNRVNVDVAEFFYLIANNPSCCPDGQRHPYKVEAVKYEAETLAVVLSIQNMDWENVASNFDLNLSRYNLPKHTKRHAHTTELTKRWFNPGKLGVSLINKLGIAPDIDYVESVYMGLDLSSEEKRKQILSDPFHEEKYLDVHCIDCHISGGIEVGLRCKAEGGEIKELIVFAQPKDLKAKLEVEFKTHIPMGQPLDYTQSVLPDLALPGFSIPRIFTFGPSLELNVGAEVYFLGIVNATAGVEVKIPNSGFIVADMLGPKSGATGFDTLKTDTEFNLNEATAQMEAGVHFGPALALGVKVLEKYGYRAVVQVKMPYLVARGWVGHESEGLCPESQEDSETTTGAKVHLACDFEIWLEIGPPDDDSLIPAPVFMPEVERILWNVEGPSKDFCMAYPIPGLSDGGSENSESGKPADPPEHPSQAAPARPTYSGSWRSGPNGERIVIVHAPRS
ncbi:hypothetical protein TWF696_008103 [Orbilia brochopaga]|uniref:Uncharacterized protein n=1 Tax=Orbilia brochopaga TaxID=3140254 RepID=A0AAV9UTA3_9PEZI